VPDSDPDARFHHAFNAGVAAVYVTISANPAGGVNVPVPDRLQPNSKTSFPLTTPDGMVGVQVVVPAAVVPAAPTEGATTG
jgi:hypothetical protein